jgi:serine-type D-Ala-D-Ala carboxypeptidase/endopeptidase (penicillin-binding protein 4)
LILNENSVTLTLLPRQVDEAVKLEWSDAIAARQWQVNDLTKTAPEATDNSIEISGNFGSDELTIEGELAIDSDSDSWDLAIVNPERYFLESLLNVLVAEGIQAQKGTIVKNLPEKLSEKELAFIESEPLALLIQKTNQESNNLYAEALLKILDSESNDKTGIEAIAQQLTSLGINPDSYSLADGSGLSRHNLVSPEAIVQTLTLMAKTPEAKTYRDSLAIAGVNGTLEGRFKDTLAEGNLQAKTGTLSGNSALSGYLTVPNYRPLVFSIIVNQSDLPISNLRTAIDEIVVLLTRLKSCDSSFHNLP